MLFLSPNLNACRNVYTYAYTYVYTYYYLPPHWYIGTHYYLPIYIYTYYDLPICILWLTTTPPCVCVSVYVYTHTHTHTHTHLDCLQSFCKVCATIQTCHELDTCIHKSRHCSGLSIIGNNWESRHGRQNCHELDTCIHKHTHTYIYQSLLTRSSQTKPLH